MFEKLKNIKPRTILYAALFTTTSSLALSAFLAKMNFFTCVNIWLNGIVVGQLMSDHLLSKWIEIDSLNKDVLEKQMNIIKKQSTLLEDSVAILKDISEVADEKKETLN